MDIQYQFLHSPNHFINIISNFAVPLLVCGIFRVLPQPLHTHNLASCVFASCVFASCSVSFPPRYRNLRGLSVYKYNSVFFKIFFLNFRSPLLMAVLLSTCCTSFYYNQYGKLNFFGHFGEKFSRKSCVIFILSFWKPLLCIMFLEKIAAEARGIQMGETWCTK